MLLSVRVVSQDSNLNCCHLIFVLVANAPSPYLPSTPGQPMTPSSASYLPGTPGGQPMTPGTGGLDVMSPVIGWNPFSGDIW